MTKEICLESEKVTIPDFVAEYIEKWKKELSLKDALEYEIDPDEKDTMEWLYNNRKSMNDQHAYLFVRAWFEGYEVEEEKLYRVIIGGGDDRDFAYVDERGYVGFVNNIEFMPYLTEKEIKAIDERYWAFAEEVVKYEK